MRVLPVPPNALGGVIGILTAEEEKDDTPFFKSIVKNHYRHLKNAVNLIKQHYMWLVPLAALWIWLESIPMISTLMNSPIIKFAIFITASWNNLGGKSVFSPGFIGREIVPFIREVKKNGFMNAVKARAQPADQKHIRSPSKPL